MPSWRYAVIRAVAVRIIAGPGAWGLAMLLSLRVATGRGARAGWVVPISCRDRELRQFNIWAVAPLARTTKCEATRHCRATQPRQKPCATRVPVGGLSPLSCGGREFWRCPSQSRPRLRAKKTPPKRGFSQSAEALSLRLCGDAQRPCPAYPGLTAPRWWVLE